jgi:hypothetical protein
MNGPRSVANRPIWTFGRVELRFMLALVVLGLITAGPFAVALVIALLLRNVTPLMVLSVIAAVALLVAGIGCVIRLWFVLIELVLQRYKGPRAAWDQSRGLIWRLIGLSFLVPLPFLICGAICGAIQANVMTYAGSILLAILGSVFAVLASMSVIGGVALAYKLTAPEPSAAVVASTS